MQEILKRVATGELSIEAASRALKLRGIRAVGDFARIPIEHTERVFRR